MKEEILKERNSSFQELVKGFSAQSGRFLTLEEAKDSAYKYVNDLQRNGGHRKVHGKKMRMKIDGKVHLEYIKDRRTYVIRKLLVDKRGISVSFCTINFFSSKGGIVYALRGIGNEVYFFTSHFFDRIAQRGYGSSHLDRIGTIKTFLLDFAEAQLGMGFTLFNKHRGSVLSYMGHGVGVGDYIHLVNDETTERMTLIMLITYLTLDMVHPELQTTLKTISLGTTDFGITNLQEIIHKYI